MTPDSPKGPEREVRPSKELVDYLRRLLGGRFDELLATANFLDEDDQASTLAVFEDVLPCVAQEIENRATAYDLMLSEVRSQRDEWKLAAEAEAALLDQEQTERRAEVSRLREQLAAQPTIPADADELVSVALNAATNRCNAALSESLDIALTGAVMDLLKSWGVSSSEVEAPQHKVTIRPDGPWLIGKCEACGLSNYTQSRERAEDWKDEHEADTLRPQADEEERVPTLEALASQPRRYMRDEGRPSGSERLAPRSGVELIADERARQVAVEGWTPEHDATHSSDDLAMAAVCYSLPVSMREMRHWNHDPGARVPMLWPWHPEYWKSTGEDRIRDLVKAGALLAAEIDRLQRQDAAQAARSEATPEFFEEDEPVTEIVKAFDEGVKLSTGRDTMAAPVRVTHIQPCWCGSCPSPSLRKEGEDSD